MRVILGLVLCVAFIVGMIFLVTSTERSMRARNDPPPPVEQILTPEAQATAAELCADPESTAEAREDALADKRERMQGQIAENREQRGY